MTRRIHGATTTVEYIFKQLKNKFPYNTWDHNNCGVCIFHVKSSLCRIHEATTTVEYVFTRRIHGATTTVEYVFFMLSQVCVEYIGPQ